MRVLLVGSGGREHALAWRLAQSENCAALFCAPGNAGIQECAECVDIQAEDIEGLVAFSQKEKIDLVMVGPEAPLVAGLVDKLEEVGIAAFGPSAAAARLEGSKAFMKDLCKRYGVLSAAYGRFTEFESAREFIEEHGAPIVIKTDGLAAGKGVIIAQTKEEAIEAAQQMLSGASFGDAGAEIVIEEFLDGEELSYFALCDGKTYIPFGSAQDHKRAFDGDEGPNTGGMGAYAPAHMISGALGKEICQNIIEPVINGMAKDGMAFKGVLFAGIMLVKGKPYLLEFNVRFGDPECQALMLRLESDLLEVIDAGARGQLEGMKDRVYWRSGSAMCVVMAANGYPAAYKKETLLKIHDEADLPQTKIFHAGTKKAEGKGAFLSVGGRVLGVSAYGENIESARARAYEAIEHIDWPEGFCRKDIGWRAG